MIAREPMAALNAEERANRLHTLLAAPMDTRDAGRARDAVEGENIAGDLLKMAYQESSALLHTFEGTA